LISKARDLDVDLPDMDIENRDVWQGNFAPHLADDVYNQLHRAVKAAQKEHGKETRERVVFGSSIFAGIAGLVIGIYRTFIAPSTIDKLEERILKLERQLKP
jgi:hypothetical protein